MPNGNRRLLLSGALASAGVALAELRGVGAKKRNRPGKGGKGGGSVGKEFPCNPDTECFCMPRLGDPPVAQCSADETDTQCCKRYVRTVVCTGDKDTANCRERWRRHCEQTCD